MDTNVEYNLLTMQIDSKNQAGERYTYLHIKRIKLETIYEI